MINDDKFAELDRRYNASSYFKVKLEENFIELSLEELGLHCQDFHVLGVFEADKQREK